MCLRGMGVGGVGQPGRDVKEREGREAGGRWELMHSTRTKLAVAAKRGWQRPGRATLPAKRCGGLSGPGKRRAS